MPKIWQFVANDDIKELFCQGKLLYKILIELSHLKGIKHSRDTRYYLWYELSKVFNGDIRSFVLFLEVYGLIIG